MSTAQIQQEKEHLLATNWMIMNDSQKEINNIFDTLIKVGMSKEQIPLVNQLNTIAINLTKQLEMTKSTLICKRLELKEDHQRQLGTWEE